MSVSIITGASSGIGKAITNYILSSSASAKVFIVARRETPLKEFVTKYGADRVSYLTGDVGEEGVALSIVDKAVEQYGGVNSVIANAGVLDPVEPVQEAHVQQWKRLFDVNFFSIVELVSRAIPHLKKTNGNVILVSSGASTNSYNGWAAYGASKAAVNHWALCVAAEVPEIKTLAVAPGVVDTNMQDDIRQIFGKKMTPEALKRFTDLKEQNQLLDPEYVATIYGNLALRGIPEALNGKYVRYNDEDLKDFA